MEIVARPGLGSTNCIVVAPAVDQKDIEKAKLLEERAKENPESVIENITESCVEVDVKRHKVIDDYNMESRVVVVGDISCVLPINKVLKRVEDLVVINALKAVPSSKIEKLNEQIKNARIELDEKTRFRDAISDKVQKKKASLRARSEGVNVANLKIRAAKQMVKSKRHEIDYVQRVIKNLKRAISAGEVDNKIYEVKHSTDEKPFIHIIKQLNGIRDQVSSYMGSYDEIQQALHLEDRIQEVLKNLSKELETLKQDVSKAELIAKAISKSYKEDFLMEKLLRAQFIAAEAIRQQAYERLNSLKDRLDDEVEEFMDELKTNEELGMFSSMKQDTLDGPPCQKFASKSVLVPDEIKSVSAVSTIETQRPILSVEEKHLDDQTKEKVAEENKQMMKTKEPANPTEMIDNQERENIDELRKADELKKEETEKKMKEQSQLDEIMKVEKTLEMNKRNAEKAQPAAEQRAQKEAEERAQKEAMMKEKARLRRLRKKNNKRPCHDASGSSINDVDVADSNEIDNTNEEPRQPQFVSKQAKQKIHAPPPVVAPKFRNIKNWLQHSRKMPIVAGLILSLLSLLSCYTYLEQY